MLLVIYKEGSSKGSSKPDRRRSEQLHLPRHDRRPRHLLDTRRQHAPLLGRIHHPPALQAEVAHALPQAGVPVLIDAAPQLDTNGQELVAIADQQVHLGTGLRAPEEHFGPDRRRKL